jgi:hypothetical protein
MDTASEARKVRAELDDLKSRFDSSDSCDSEATLQRLSVLAALAFKRGIDIGLWPWFPRFNGDGADEPWPWPALQDGLFPSELDRMRWRGAWLQIAILAQIHFRGSIVGEPLCTRQLMSSDAGSVGYVHPDDYRARAIEYATICGLLAGEIEDVKTAATDVTDGQEPNPEATHDTPHDTAKKTKKNCDVTINTRWPVSTGSSWR